MPDVNVPLLRKQVEWVEAQAALPEIDREWAQAQYRTDPVDRAYDWLWDRPIPAHAAPEISRLSAIAASHCGTAYCVAGKVAADHDPRYATATTVEGIHVAEKAADLLGLTDDQARELFHEDNTPAQIRGLAEHFAGERL